MRPRLHHFTCVTATLLLSTSPVALADTTPASSETLAQVQNVQGRKAKAERLYQTGEQQYHQGQFREALKSFQQTLGVLREFQEHQGEAATLNYIGQVYFSLGQYQQALKSLEQAKGIAKEVGNRAGEGTALSDIGQVYFSLGQYPQALKSFEQARSIFRAIGNRVGEGVALNSIGQVYFSLGQYQQALKSLEQAQVIARDVSNRAGEATTLNSIGVVYEHLGQYLQALKSLEQAKSIVKEISNRVGEGTVLSNIGGIYSSQGQYLQALKVLEQALVIHKEVDNKAEEGITLNSIGQVYFSLGQYPQALKSFEQARSISQAIGNRAGEAITLSNIGIFYFSLDQFPKAERTLFATMEVQESLRPGLADADKVSIFDRQALTYPLLQRSLLAQKKINAALEIAERGRARAFVELLASRLATNPDTQLATKSPTVGQMQQIAKAQNSTLVQYSITGDEFKIQGKPQFRESELYMWVIKPTGEVTFRQADLKPLWQQKNTSLYDLVAITRDSIGVRGRSVAVLPRPDAPQAQTQLQRLHELLINPIADLLPTNPNAHVTFVPQGELFLVPFAALQDKSGKYLVEQHTILTAPSIQVLELTRQQQAKVRKAALKQAVVLGNPTMPSVPLKLGEPPEQLASLPGAEQEAKAIAPLLQTQAVIGSKATETVIKQQMTQAGMIHLATHGLLDDSKELGIPGAIALAPSGKDDGLLTASEILDMKLNAELVVLSACDTGRGQITGDGVIGLSRSLISAGVPSVIASLWSVPDAPTASLMTQFYQSLQQNPDKAQALRQAMLTTMKQHPEPKNWAAFTLIGEAE